MPDTPLEVTPLEESAIAELEAIFEVRSLEGFDKIGPSLDGEKVYNALLGSCKKLVDERKKISRLKLNIGRLLLVIQDHPSVYQSRGYAHFNDFVGSLGEKIGLPRSEAYGTKRLASKWPTMSAEDAEVVGYGALAEISKYTCEGQPNAPRLLELAKTHTLEELKNLLPIITGVPREETELASINILCTKAVAERWKKFSSRPEIVSVVGNESGGAILDALMSEAEDEWIIKGTGYSIVEAEERIPF